MKKIDLDTVKRARARAVADPGILIKGSLAVDASGKRCDATSRAATCFCTVGLIMNEGKVREWELPTGPYDTVAKSLGLQNRYEAIDETVMRNDKDVSFGEPANCDKLKRAPLDGFDFLISYLEKKNAENHA